MTCSVAGNASKGRMLRDYFGEEDGSKVFDGTHKS